MISEMANNSGFNMDCVFKKKNLLENNFIFKINRRK
jgi:hypothetical protein